MKTCFVFFASPFLLEMVHESSHNLAFNQASGLILLAATTTPLLVIVPVAAFIQACRWRRRRLNTLIEAVSLTFISLGSFCLGDSAIEMALSRHNGESSFLAAWTALIIIGVSLLFRLEGHFQNQKNAPPAL